MDRRLQKDFFTEVLDDPGYADKDTVLRYIFAVILIGVI